MISAIAVQGIINSKSSQGWAASGSQAATIEVFFFLNPCCQNWNLKKKSVCVVGARVEWEKDLIFFFLKQVNEAISDNCYTGALFV